MAVAFFGAHGKKVFDPDLRCAKRFLQYQTEIAFELWDLGQQMLHGVFFNGNDFAVFDCLDVKIGRCTIVEPEIIGKPPILDGELDRLLVAFFVYEIKPATAFRDKKLRCAALSGLEQVFFLFDFPEIETGNDVLLLGWIERDEFRDVVENGRIHDAKIKHNCKCTGRVRDGSKVPRTAYSPATIEAKAASFCRRYGQRPQRPQKKPNLSIGLPL